MKKSGLKISWETEYVIKDYGNKIIVTVPFTRLADNKISIKPFDLIVVGEDMDIVREFVNKNTRIIKNKNNEYITLEEILADVMKEVPRMFATPFGKEIK